MRTPLILLAMAALSAPAAGAQDEQDRTITVQTEIPIVVKMELPPSKKCGAEITLSYFQRGEVASVDGELNNSVCAASSGEYTLAISISDTNQQLRTLEFNEAWQRSDAQPVSFEKEYPIGADVDLVRVRARRITCTCAEAPLATPAE